MIQSMTGFGKSVLQLPSKKITVEIKSLNSKNLDLNARHSFPVQGERTAAAKQDLPGSYPRKSRFFGLC